MHDQPHFSNDLAEAVEKEEAITIVPKDVAPIDATAVDTMERAREVRF